MTEKQRKQNTARQRRFRENNREKFNEYQREYKRKYRERLKTAHGASYEKTESDPQ